MKRYTIPNHSKNTRARLLFFSFSIALHLFFSAILYLGYHKEKELPIPNSGAIYKISLIPPSEKRKDPVVPKQTFLISEKTESLPSTKPQEAKPPVVAKKTETPKPLQKKQSLSVPQKTIPKTAPVVKEEKMNPEILSHHKPNTTSKPQIKRPDDTPTIIAPYPVYNPSPSYPSRAFRMKIQGRVVLGVEIHASGLPGKIKVQASSGYAILDKAALEILQKWRFSPAFQEGKAIASFLEIPIVFQLLPKNK